MVYMQMTPEKKATITLKGHVSPRVLVEPNIGTPEKELNLNISGFFAVVLVIIHSVMKEESPCL